MQTSKRQPRKTRAPRVSVPNSERVLIVVGGEHCIGTMHKLSSTGGSVRMPRQFEPGKFADMRLSTTEGKINAAIEFLAVMPGYPPTQPFRFVHMDVADTRRLEKGVSKLMKQGFGERPQGWGLRSLLHTAQRSLTSLTQK